MPHATRNARLLDENGQALIIAAVSMFMLVGFLGLAIDVGHIRYAKRQLQVAADAAAIAGALELRVCNSVLDCPAMQAAAQSALVENGFTGSAISTNCSPPSSVGLTLVVNNAPCALGSGDPNWGNANYVEVVVSQQQRTYFARILGFDHLPVTVRAEATRSRNAPCIYALDPTGVGAINVVAGLGFVSACGIVDESNSPAALTCLIGAGIYAPKISVTGGTAGLLCASNPAPQTAQPVPTPADPLAYLPAPPTAANACGTSTGSPYLGSSQAVTIILGLGANLQFYPGVYCGGISITASLLSSITFNPGTYILRDGPGPLGPLFPTSGLTVTIGVLSTITGNGVMFYNAGSAGGFSITAPAAVGLSNFNLSAPTSGTYAGILFFQAHGITNTGTFLANLLQGSTVTGAVYEPDALVSYGVGAVSASYNIIVAKDIQFTAPILSIFGNNYAALPSGSPLHADTSVLVQ